MTQHNTPSLAEAIDLIVNHGENIPAPRLEEASIVIYEKLGKLRRNAGITYNEDIKEQAAYKVYFKFLEGKIKTFERRSEGEAHSFLKEEYIHRCMDGYRRWKKRETIPDDKDKKKAANETNTDVSGTKENALETNDRKKDTPKIVPFLKDLEYTNNDGSVSNDQALENTSSQRSAVTPEDRVEWRDIFDAFVDAQDAYLHAIQSERADRQRRDKECTEYDRRRIEYGLTARELYDQILESDDNAEQWTGQERQRAQNRIERQVSRYREAFHAYLDQRPHPDLEAAVVQYAHILLDRLRGQR